MDAFPEEAIFRQIHSGCTEMPAIPSTARAVDIRRNELAELSFSQDSAIEYLDFSDNRVRDLAPLASLKSLRILDGSYNLITGIPALPLPHLKELYLISNDITTIEGADLHTLEKLDLANNSITSLEGIAAPALHEMYLANNQISSVTPLQAAALPVLRILDLQYNALESVDCATLPPTLEVLLLQGNRDLSVLENLDKLSRLKVLGLRGTRIVLSDRPAGVDIW